MANDIDPLTTRPSVLVTAPGPERAAWYLGWLLTYLATGEETGGRFSLTEVRGRRDRSAAPPLHVHTREEECFYVIAGAITCYVGDEIVDVPAGGFIVLPRDLPHRYELASEEARLLNLCVPAGFEGFYRALSEPALQPILPPPPESPPDGARMLAAAAAHGVEILAAPAANGGSTPVPHAPARAIDHEPPCQPHGPRPGGMTWTATVSTA